MKLQLMLVSSLVCGAAALAGDLDVLPTSETELQEKIDAFIKRGDKVSDAISLLRSFRFKCEEAAVGTNLASCLRSDIHGYAVLHYDVSIESKNGKVKRTSAMLSISARKP